MFFYAQRDGYASSPISTTSCETSLESSTYMEDQPFDCAELSPGSLKSTSSSTTSSTMEVSSNKFSGSAYVKSRKWHLLYLKARKQRQQMKAKKIEYDDPPLDHLLLLGPSMSFESDDSSMESDASMSMESDDSSMSMESDSSSVQSKSVKEATLMIKMRHSGGEEVVPFDCESSPPLPLQPTLSTEKWPQSSWKLEKTYENPSISVRDSIVNSIKVESASSAPVSNTRTTQSDASDTAQTRRYRHIEQVKAMARSRKERNGKTRKHENDTDPSKSKASNSFRDFVDHLLTVNATNQLCRSPEPTQTTQTLPSAYRFTKKKVSWQEGDPNLPKPVLRRRSNSPTRPNLPKAVLRRAKQHLAQRYSSKPPMPPPTNVPYDEGFVSSPAGGWKSAFACGAPRKVLDSP